ncbi:MAG: hypothetical protein ACK4F5_05425 [Aliihoeflea sp.]
MNQHHRLDPRHRPATAPARSTSVAAADHPRLFTPGSPILEGQDIAAMVLAAIMALGPLAAVAFGFGP